MRRRLVPLVAALLVLAALPAGVTAVGADGFVSVSATVSPTEPVPEEPFTVTANVTNDNASDSPYVVEKLELRRGPTNTSETVSEEEVSVSIDAGASASVPVEATINETGTHRLFLHLELRESGASERRRVVQPVTVEVYQPDPQVGVSTDPSPPGEEQTMTVSVSNGLDSAIRNVELVVDGQPVEVRNDRRVAAAVQAGDSGTFEFTVVPPEKRRYDVNATLRYTLDGNRRQVTATLSPDFSTSPSTTERPGIEVRTESAAPGEPRTTTVTVSNGLESTIRNVELLVGGESVEVRNPRRVTATVAAGGSQAFEFTTDPASASTLPLNVTLRYTVDEQRRGVTRSLPVDFGADDEPADHPRIELSAADAVPGATRPVNVTVANGLNRSVRQVSLQVSAPDVSFDVTERVRARLAAGETATFRFPASVAEAGSYPVNVTLQYTDRGVGQRVTRTIQGSFDAPANPGRVNLTSVEAVARGGSLELSATASNVGSDAVESVVVSVDGQRVSAADYFVGEIEGSDFASFTLSTSLRGNVSSVPVEVSYVVDGVRKTATTTVPVQQRIVRSDVEPSGGGPPLVPGVIGLVVLVGAVIAYRRWR